MHRRLPVSTIECGSCHNPHGSDQPSLIRSKPHAVLMTCGRCHDVNGPKPAALLAKGTDLCFRCHSAVKVASQKPGAHKALQSGCVSCHSPHAADTPGLVKGDGRQICFSCHAGIKKMIAASFSIHVSTGEAGRCTACHAPHQSDNGRLLRAPKVSLCVTCHKDHSSFSHPTGPTVNDPRSGQPLTCLSCHAPHGSAFPSMLIANPQRELCLQCHTEEGPSLNPGHSKTGKVEGQ